MTHHNSQLRQYQPKKTYFITCNVKDRLNFFKEELFCELFIAELGLVKELKQFKLHAFGLNYDHFHLLLTPGKEYNVSQIMFSIKKQFSHDVNRILGYNKFEESNLKATKRLVAFRLPAVHSLKNDLSTIRQKFIQKYGINHNIPKFRWQSSFHDHVIRDQKDYNHHLHYTIYNYLKHKLPKTWKYTSLNYSDMVDLEILW